MDIKQAVEISKCLSNSTRLEILEWLKDPVKNFPPNTENISNTEGVCVSHIYEKTNLSQSTISIYLNSMEKCGLLKTTRVGKWTFFRRDQETIEQYIAFIR